MRSNTAEGVTQRWILGGVEVLSAHERASDAPRTAFSATISRFSEDALPSTPPCRKSKDYDAINLYDDIAPGSVRFHHPLESDLGEYGAFPIFERVVCAFDESDDVWHDSSVRVSARGSAASN